MWFFSKKRKYDEKEGELIEKLEKRIKILLEEWNKSYKGKEAVQDYQFESLFDGIFSLESSLMHYGHPPPGWTILIIEKKMYKELWNQMIKFCKRITKLIIEGEYHGALKLLLLELQLFEKEVNKIQHYEIKRFDKILKCLDEYLDGTLAKRIEPYQGDFAQMTGVEKDHKWKELINGIYQNVLNANKKDLDFPENEFDKKYLVSLTSRWVHPLFKKFGVEEAKDFINRYKRLKKARIAFTKRIISEIQIGSVH